MKTGRVDITRSRGDRLQEILWFLILVATPLFVNLWVEQQFEASKIWLSRTLIWSSAVVWLTCRLNGSSLRVLPQPVSKLILALIVMILVATVLSTNLYIAFWGSLERAAGSLTQLSYILFFFIVATSLDRQRYQLFLYCIVLTAFPLCLLALAQHAGWQPLALLTDARTPLTTTLGRSNFSGAYLAQLLPLSLALLYVSNGFWKRNFCILLVSLIVVVLFLTQARSAWIAAICGTCVFGIIYFNPRKSLYFIFSGMVVLLAGGLFFSLYESSIPSSGSFAARWTIWKTSIELLWPRVWVGYGADTLGLHFTSVFPPELVYYQGRGIVVDRAHNWLLDWSLSYGVVATILVMLLCLIIVHKGMTHLILQEKSSSSGNTTQKKMCIWLAACIASVCTQLLGNLFLFEVASTALVFWFLLAVITVIASPSSYPIANKPVSIWLRFLNYSFTLPLLCLSIWHANTKPMLADISIWQGTHALNQGKPHIALQKYAKAATCQPFRAEYHLAHSLTAMSLTKFESAHQAINKAISLQPMDPLLFLHLASIYAAESTNHPQKNSQVYAAFSQAIKMAPTYALTYQQFADYALRIGDWQTALNMARQSILLDETDNRAFSIAGWSHLHFGNIIDAQSMFEKAIFWSPDSADNHLGLATSLFHQGKIVKAKQALEKSLIINPTYEPSLTLQRQLSRY